MSVPLFVNRDAVPYQLELSNQFYLSQLTAVKPLVCWRARCKHHQLSASLCQDSVTNRGC